MLSYIQLQIRDALLPFGQMAEFALGKGGKPVGRHKAGRQKEEHDVEWYLRELHLLDRRRIGAKDIKRDLGFVSYVQRPGCCVSADITLANIRHDLRPFRAVRNYDQPFDEVDMPHQMRHLDVKYEGRRGPVFLQEITAELEPNGHRQVLHVTSKTRRRRCWQRVWFRMIDGLFGGRDPTA